MKRLIYIVSDIDKSLHFEWVVSSLSVEFDLVFILIGRPDTYLEKYLNQHRVKTYFVEFNHSKIEFLRLWFKVFSILVKERPDIIHTHLWIANVIGLSAGFVSRVKKRIYTRHHAMIHHTEVRSGLKWDKLCNRLATHIIAPSVNVKNILLQLDKAAPSKVHLIHHGFDFRYFNHVNANTIEVLRKKYNIPNDAFVFGVISRFIQWKGVQYIIPAFQKVLHRFPNAYLVLANASGNYAVEIRGMLKKLPSASYTEIVFENDLAALYRTFDAFIHVPTDPTCEAFGQTYIEAMIIGIPSIFTLSGIAAEVVQTESNALVVEFKDEEDLFRAMMRMMSDSNLRARLTEAGKTSVARFSIENYTTPLMSLYLS